MRALILLALLLPGAAAAQTCTAKISGAELVTPGALTMSVNPTLPPMQYADASGTLKGMRVELGAEIAHRLCLDPAFVKVEFAAMIPGLAARRWDMIDTGMFFTAERAKIVQLVRYEQQAISLSVARDNPLKIGSVADLAGHAVGVEQGGFEFARTRDMAAEVAKLGGQPVEVRPFDNFALAFQALRAGQVDAVVSIDSTAKEYQERGDFTQAASGLYGTPIAFGFASKPLAAAVAEALTAMRADGRFDKLLGQYGVKPWDGAFEVIGP
jgi:polar amino acid transport system substrate-binding protein